MFSTQCSYSVPNGLGEQMSHISTTSYPHGTCDDTEPAVTIRIEIFF